MTKKEAETKLEYLGTSDEFKARGLRRIKRRHYTGPPELLPKDERVQLEVSLDADVAIFFDKDPIRINSALRAAMEERKTAQKLLDDREFVRSLKEKLAA
jgi:uncharacterized protein (DUF4415 family)